MTEDFKYTNRTADQSAEILTKLLYSRVPFFFTKYGDGALECINGIGTRTRDLEYYTPQLAADLVYSWGILTGLTLAGKVNLILADWLSAIFNEAKAGRHEELYRGFVRCVEERATFLNYEAVLIDRRTPQLMAFYKALREDPRRKVIMGPDAWGPAMRMLKASYHIVTPLKDLHAQIGRLNEALEREKPEILLYGAGMAGTVPVIEQALRVPGATYINLGSALDPLFRGHTRINQLSPAHARTFFRGLLK